MLEQQSVDLITHPAEEACYRAAKETMCTASGSVIIKRDGDFEVHYTSPLDLST